MEPDWMIARAQAEYARCIDDGRLEDWPGFFEPDCHYRITTADNHRAGYPAGIIDADSRAMLEDRVSALREANIYEQHSYRHIIGLPANLRQNGDRVHSESPFIVVRIMRDGGSDIFVTGRYIDTWRLHEDGVRIADRLVICDSARIDTLLALPL